MHQVLIVLGDVQQRSSRGYYFMLHTRHMIMSKLERLKKRYCCTERMKRRNSLSPRKRKNGKNCCVLHFDTSVDRPELLGYYYDILPLLLAEGCC